MCLRLHKNKCYHNFIAALNWLVIIFNDFEVKWKKEYLGVLYCRQINKCILRSFPVRYPRGSSCYCLGVVHKSADPGYREGGVCWKDQHMVSIGREGWGNSSADHYTLFCTTFFRSKNERKIWWPWVWLRRVNLKWTWQVPQKHIQT